MAPALLIGHSLGGAAVLRSAGRIDSARAVVTILSPIDETAPKRGSAEALLGVLDSAEFASAAPGDPDRMEREIAANREAWGD